MNLSRRHLLSGGFAGLGRVGSVGVDRMLHLHRASSPIRAPVTLRSSSYGCGQKASTSRR